MYIVKPHQFTIYFSSLCLNLSAINSLSLDWLGKGLFISGDGPIYSWLIIFIKHASPVHVFDSLILAISFLHCVHSILSNTPPYTGVCLYDTLVILVPILHYVISSSSRNQVISTCSVIIVLIILVLILHYVISSSTRNQVISTWSVIIVSKMDKYFQFEVSWCPGNF